MGRKRKGRYIIEWWVSDHPPRHVHVFSSSGEFLGRVVLDSMKGLEPWTPPRELVGILREMLKRGEL